MSRVRYDFNPGGDEMVNRIKRYTADLIDLCEDLKKSASMGRTLIGFFHEEDKMSVGSLGMSRVRYDFNPGGDDVVSRIKRHTADLIDLCEDLKKADPRLAALAQTAYEEAAMWAVKAATAPNVVQSSKP